MGIHMTSTLEDKRKGSIMEIHSLTIQDAASMYHREPLPWSLTESGCLEPITAGSSQRGEHGY